MEQTERSRSMRSKGNVSESPGARSSSDCLTEGVAVVFSSIILSFVYLFVNLWHKDIKKEYTVSQKHS